MTVDVFSDKVSKESTQATLAKLRELGGAKITEESGVAYHHGKQVLLPEGMTLKQASKFLTAQAASMEETHNFNKTFRYRPWDGAYNFQETLKEVFGISGTGRPIHTFFGTTPPEYRQVEIGPGNEVEVPWGHIEFSPLEAILQMGAVQDPTYGYLFHVTISAPKKYGPEIRGLFIAVEDRLRKHSIYKGKAIVGVGRVTREGYENPTFLDPYAIDPEKVAYRQEVFDRLRSSVWGPIQTADLQREDGLKLNRKTLLYGPYGTGKSLAGGLTARVAVDEGWTFIQTKTGDEPVEKVLKTAELYAPAVVFIEDVDNLIDSDPQEMSKLLEMFDGISAKDKEVMVLMTSNHVDSMSKGMMRVGRIDAAIEIGDLDPEGIRRLLRGHIDVGKLADDLDFEVLCDSMAGYEPAFIMGTFNGAKNNAIIREGSRDYVLTTEDFKLAADTLRNQHDTHLNALDRPVVETFGQSLKKVVAQATAETVQAHKVNIHNEGEIITLDA